MPTPSFYRFSLKANDTTWYYVDNGTVRTSATGRFTYSSPIEWKDTEIKYARDAKWHGSFRNMTNTFSMVEDAALILRYIKYTQGYEGVLIFYMEKRVNDTWLYEKFYQCEFDLSKSQDVLTSFKCNVLEGGLVSLLRAYETTPYQIPFGEDVTTVYMDGIFLKGRYNYKLSDSYVNSSGSSIREELNLITVHTVDDGDFPVAIPNTAYNKIMSENYSDNDYHSRTDNSYREYWLEALQPMNLKTLRYKAKIYWKGNGRTGGSQRLVLEMILCKEFGTFILRTPIYIGPTITAGLTGTLNYEEIDATISDFDIDTNVRVFVNYYIEEVTPGTGSELFYIGVETEEDADASEIYIDVIFRSLPTFNSGYRWFEAFYKLIYLLTEGKYSAYSAFLSNPASKINVSHPFQQILLCGNQLRGLPDSKMILQVDKMYKDARNRFACGLGIIDNKVRIEPLSFFYDKTRFIAHLGKAKGLVRSVPEQLLGSNLKAGYPTKDENALNGKEEYNTTAAFKLPVKRATTELDFTTDFNAGMYLIEPIRNNLSKKESTPDNSDNEIFILSVESGANTVVIFSKTITFFKLYRPLPLGYAAGITFPETAYNVDISPAHIMQANQQWFNSILHQNTGEIVFQTSDKNQAFESYFKEGLVYSPLVKENGNFSVTSDTLFLPITDKFECDAPINLYKMLNENPNGYFTYYDDNGVLVKAFMMEGSMKPAKKDAHEFTMLLTPDNDLNQFIR